MRELFIVNDILGGCLGEKKVFWNYMLDSIPNLIGVDQFTVGRGDFENQVRNKINSLRTQDTPPIIIQNATFIGCVDPSAYTIAFLQDNLRSMNRYDPQQEYNLRSARKIVANSIHTANSYPEYNCDIIPIGIDSELFAPKNKEEMRIKYNIPLDKKIGIFVGALNDVKGWGKVRSIIESRQDIFFILVSKHNTDVYNSPNSRLFTLIDQDTLTDLHGASDFFILGSPVETQCLAALEANFCNLPVIMHNTGIYADWNDKDLFGVFGDDFNLAIDKVLSSEFNVRSNILTKGLSINDMINKWIKLLGEI